MTPRSASESALASQPRETPDGQKVTCKCNGSHSADGIASGFPIFDYCSGTILTQQELKKLEQYHKTGGKK